MDYLPESRSTVIANRVLDDKTRLSDILQSFTSLQLPHSNITAKRQTYPPWYRLSTDKPLPLKIISSSNDAAVSLVFEEKWAIYIQLFRISQRQ